MLVVWCMVLAVGTSIAGPAPAAYAADISPPHLRGLGMGMYRSSGDVGFLIGPPLLGLVADASSYGWALMVNAALMAVSALFFLTARETVQRPARGAGGADTTATVPVDTTADTTRPTT
jgi:MFS family permease